MTHMEHSYDGSNMRRNEIMDLRDILQNPEIQRDQSKCRKYVQQVIAYMTLGMDVSSLFSEMIKLSATSDLLQKKLVYLYIRVQAKSNKDLAILVISTLTKDARDENAIVRGLALRTLCELQVPSLVDYIKEPLLYGLSDKIAYVQRIAIIGALKVFHFAPCLIREMNIVNVLLDILMNKDRQVMANSIFALREILCDKNGFPFRKDIVDTIFSRLPTLDEWAQSNVISLLSYYRPGDQEEIISVLNKLDDQLKHPNKGLVLATAKLFLRYTTDLVCLKADIYNRLRGPLLSIATSSIAELSYTGLCALLSIYRSRTHLLAGKYKAFFLRGNESPYLKRLKLSALVDVVIESQVDSTLSELRYYTMDPDIRVANFATKCIGKVGMKCKSTAASCLDILLNLLYLDLDHIVACIFEAVKEILTEARDLGNSIVGNIYTYWEKATDPCAKTSVVWILGEFGHSITRSPHILEDIADSLEQEQSPHVKLELLNAALRLFFKRPPEFQNVVGRILFQLIGERASMDVHDRALFYYRSLRQDATKVLRLLTTVRDLKTSAVVKNKHLDIKEVCFEDLNTIPGLLSQQS